MPAPDPASAHLRAHHEGTLLSDGPAERIRFVRHAGSLVCPAGPALFEAENLVLFVPEEDDPDELQVSLSAAPAPEGAGPERWRAYHGEPDAPRWAACPIDGARFRGSVVEHEPLSAISPIASAEPELCRILNADRAKLATICKLIAGVAPHDPIAVGVDDLGIDIRARFGIIRLPFRTPTPTIADARARIAALFGAHA